MQKQVHAIRKFNRFYTNFLGLLNETLMSSPLTLTEGRILYEIDGLTHCRAKELIDILNLDRGYMSRVLKRLERIGLIYRAADPGDKRVRTINLTDDGKLLLQNINRDASQLIGGIVKALSNAERKVLVSAMQDIETILSNRADLLRLSASKPT